MMYLLHLEVVGVTTQHIDNIILLIIIWNLLLALKSFGSGLTSFTHLILVSLTAAHICSHLCLSDNPDDLRCHECACQCDLASRSRLKLWPLGCRHESVALQILAWVFWIHTCFSWTDSSSMASPRLGNWCEGKCAQAENVWARAEPFLHFVSAQR